MSRVIKFVNFVYLLIMKKILFWLQHKYFRIINNYNNHMQQIIKNYLQIQLLFIYTISKNIKYYLYLQNSLWKGLLYNTQMIRQHQHFYPKNNHRPKSKPSTQKKYSSLFDIHTSLKNSFYEKQKNQKRSNSINQKNFLQTKNLNLRKPSKKFMVYHSENSQQSDLENVKNAYISLISKQSAQNTIIQYPGQQLSFANKIRLSSHKKKTFRNNFVFINQKQFNKKQTRYECQNLFVKSDKKQILEGLAQIERYKQGYMKIQKSNTSKKLIQDASRKPQSQRQSRSKNWCQDQQKPKQHLLKQKQNSNPMIANANNGINQNLINLSLSKAIKYRTKSHISRSRNNKKMIRPLELNNCNYEIQLKFKGWQTQLEDDYDFTHCQ